MKTLREYIDQLDEISRRDFLKGAGAAAVAGAIGTPGQAKADPVYDPKTKKWDYIPNRNDAEIDMVCLYAVFKLEFPAAAETQQMKNLITQYVKLNPDRKQEVIKDFNMWTGAMSKMRTNDPSQYKDRLESDIKYRNQIMSYFKDLMEFNDSVKIPDELTRILEISKYK